MFSRQTTLLVLVSIVGVTTKCNRRLFRPPQDRILASLEEVFEEVKTKGNVREADMPDVEVRSTQRQAIFVGLLLFLVFCAWQYSSIRSLVEVCWWGCVRSPPQGRLTGSVGLLSAQQVFQLSVYDL